MDNRKILLILSASICLAVSLSCGSDNKAGTTYSGTGTVALYLTDDISTYQQVNMSVQQVSLINSGTQQSCRLLASPVGMDITKFANIMELMAVADCTAGAYNRINVQLQQRVFLVNGSSQSSSCRLSTSGGVEGALPCDSLAGVCSFDLSGAFRRAAFDISAGQTNNLALDFDLSKFSVTNFGDAAACELSINIAALQPSAIIARHDPEAVSGRVSGLDTVARSFTLRSGHRPFKVSYRYISGAAQPGIDELLQAAEEERFKIRVTAEHIGVTKTFVEASALSVKVEGTLSSLNTSTNTFVLTHKPPDRSVTVNYAPPTQVMGILEDQAQIEVIVYGYDVLKDQYLASLVEREDKNGIDD